MVRLRRRMLRIAGLSTVLVMLPAASYAFTAGNNVNPSQAGNGVGTVSGYTVTNISYTMFGYNPRYLQGVMFTLTPLAGGAQPDTVKARATAGGVWETCTLVAPFPDLYTCAFVPVLPIAGINNLEVAAAD